MKKTRYAIKHKPTGKFYYEDEGGSFLLEETDAFITFGRREDAEDSLEDMNDIVYDEVGTFHDEIPISKTEFEVVEI